MKKKIGLALAALVLVAVIGGSFGGVHILIDPPSGTLVTSFFLK